MICQIPTAIMFIVKSVYKSSEYPYLDAPYRILGNIFNFLVTINAAANFLLYCAFSARYRRTLLSTFFGRCYRLSSPAHSTITTPEPNHLKRGNINYKTSYFVCDFIIILKFCLQEHHDQQLDQSLKADQLAEAFTSQNQRMA